MTSFVLKGSRVVLIIKIISVVEVRPYERFVIIKYYGPRKDIFPVFYEYNHFINLLNDIFQMLLKILVPTIFQGISGMFGIIGSTLYSIFHR